MAKSRIKTISNEAMNALKTELPLPAPSGKEVEFKFTAPAAKQVTLAGDFTEWENRAIQMKQMAGGIWFATVTLAPGSYAYRFIADGQWQEDTRARAFAPNPYGSQNSVVKVG